MSVLLALLLGWGLEEVLRGCELDAPGFGFCSHSNCLASGAGGSDESKLWEVGSESAESLGVWRCLNVKPPERMFVRFSERVRIIIRKSSGSRQYS